MTREEEIASIIKELEDANWHIYCEPYCFRYSDVNRYVDIDYPYVDVYNYVDGEKYCGYLTFIELSLFNKLVNAIRLLQHKQEICYD